MSAPEGMQACPTIQCLPLCLCSGPWEAFLEATVAGTRNVVKAAQAAGVPRLVHISTEVRCCALVQSLSCAGGSIKAEAWGPVVQALLPGSLIMLLAATCCTRKGSDTVTGGRRLLLSVTGLQSLHKHWLYLACHCHAGAPSAWHAGQLILQQGTAGCTALTYTPVGRTAPYAEHSSAHPSANQATVVMRLLTGCSN